MEKEDIMHTDNTYTYYFAFPFSFSSVFFLNIQTHVGYINLFF